MHIPAVDESELQKIAATPVGRRWLLKVGGAGLLATALGSSSATAQAEPPTPARRRRPRHRREIRDVFLALGDVSAFREFTLRVAATDYPVRVLTGHERRALRRRGGLFSVIDLDRLTHFAPSIPLSTNAPSLLIVLGRRRADDRQGVVCERMSSPRAAAVRVARAGIKATGSPAKLYAHSVWLRRLGVHRLRDLDRLHAADFADLDIVMDNTTTAAALVNVHPEVLNLDGTQRHLGRVRIDPGQPTPAAPLSHSGLAHPCPSPAAVGASPYQAG